jgi:hypothetical protein
MEIRPDPFFLFLSWNGDDGAGGPKSLDEHVA